MQYIETVNNELKQYFNILCDGDYPNFINDYINTKALQRISGVGMFCGADYQKLLTHDIKYWYSRLDHSIVCALMAWHFTHDKTQAIAALFHDIGAPVFSHSIDYMLGDYLNQESSELSIKEVIENSSEILDLLKKDNINIDDVYDISRFTVVENKKPKICVDRLDGIFTTGLIWGRFWSIDDIKEIYQTLIISTNEDNEPEISFNDIEIAEKFFEGSNKYSIMTQSNEDKLSLQLLGDIVKEAIDNQVMILNDLYYLTEKDIIKKIENSNCQKLLKMWSIFKNLSQVYGSDNEVKDKYCISIECKKRYVNPLCNINGNIDRLVNISIEAKEALDKYFNYCDFKYAYIDYTLD
jgi:HD superfamily phosphohydrolase